MNMINHASSKIILIVDDERFNISLLVDILRPDYTTVVAKNGETALRRAKSDTPPDLILLDIMMPDMDGYEVCRQLKADDQTRDIPIIFVTAMTEASAETRGLELGAVDYITKPISPPIVQARVKTHLKLRAAHQRLERQNAELIEADQLKQQVERIARHDLKSPLNGVIGYADLLLNDPSLAPEHRKKLQVIRRSGFNALHMVNLSLGLYRMEQGSYQLDAQDVDLLSILRNIKADLVSWLLNQQLTLDIRVNGQAVDEVTTFFVLGEEVLCYSMLANLVKNALEASPEQQTVTITLNTDASGPTATVRIHNRGAVPESIRQRFFDKYTTSGKKSGTGLGTYSARLITETMGGTIGMQSSDDEGTEIRVTLPRNPARDPVNPVPQQPASTPAPDRVRVARPATSRRDTSTGDVDPIDPGIRMISGVIVSFINDVPQHLLELQQALTDQDADRASNATECLKKIASGIRAHRVVSQSTRLHGQIEMEDWPQAQQVYQKLAEEIQRALQALSQPSPSKGVQS
ncbi:MAG: hybrid sensor histidine kinase/response regulator [Magnetococcales bacterium]|nr:hybrid sensor histidine kinase/response regulator [Magnetococcales bacterium]